MEARAAGHLKNGPRAHGYPDGSGTPREPRREVVLVNGADFSLGSSARKLQKGHLQHAMANGGLDLCQFDSSWDKLCLYTSMWGGIFVIERQTCYFEDAKLLSTDSFCQSWRKRHLGCLGGTGTLHDTRSPLRERFGEGFSCGTFVDLLQSTINQHQPVINPPAWNTETKRRLNMSIPVVLAGAARISSTESTESAVYFILSLDYKYIYIHMYVS